MSNVMSEASAIRNNAPALPRRHPCRPISRVFVRISPFFLTRIHKKKKKYPITSNKYERNNETPPRRQEQHEPTPYISVESYAHIVRRRDVRTNVIRALEPSERC